MGEGSTTLSCGLSQRSARSLRCSYCLLPLLSGHHRPWLFLAALGWIETARLIRGQTISLKHKEYLLAARAVGCTDLRLMIQYILPNVLSIAIISMTISAGALILLESGLSFLGLGVRPPTPTWGNMLTESRAYFDKGIHLVIFPGVAITVTVLCFFLLGDGLRDALDPRQTYK
jgi:peptide/nickel transport system permease protein